MAAVSAAGRPSSISTQVQNAWKYSDFFLQNFFSFFFLFYILFDTFLPRLHCAHWSKMSRNIKKKISKIFPFFYHFFFILSMVCLLPPLQILHNLLADRPAPRGAAGGAGGDPPAKAKRLLLRYCKKKVTCMTANWGFLEVPWGLTGDILGNT